MESNQYQNAEQTSDMTDMPKNLQNSFALCLQTLHSSSVDLCFYDVKTPVVLILLYPTKCPKKKKNPIVTFKRPVHPLSFKALTVFTVYSYIA